MPPITLMVKPASGACNMRCRYCFYSDVTSKREIKDCGIMSRETLEVLVKKALAYAEGNASFIFQGGEPTLAGLEFYRTLLCFQEKYNTKGVNITNSIQTNGYAIDAEWAKFFADNHFLVGLSLDGYRGAHDIVRVDAKDNGTYSKVIRTAELFNKYQVEYNILCVVHKTAAKHPVKTYRALKQYRFLQFIPCMNDFDGTQTEYSLTAKDYGEFLKQTFDLYYEDFMQNRYVSVRTFDNYVGMLMGKPPESCAMNGVCGRYFVAEGDGSIYPCDFYVLDEWRIGDITVDSFVQMEQSETVRQFLESSRHVDEKCRSCQWLRLCRGGCRRDREPFQNGKPRLNIYCESYREFFAYAYERMYKMAQIIAKSAIR